ncbi:hypothetical protein BDN67DRAFT_892139 [Paxillus ammoniavirescens]|nr:hypothetical protein BDN67DRAFT_892139 [Paxillus ammoniavirescens]
MARFCLHSIQLFSIFLAKCLFPVTHAQSISTNTVPPLQWLNITGLIQGPPAPALKYPSIGYDDTTRTVIIFGGESSSGIATSQTFLLNLASILWTTPAAQSDLPMTTPPARYMAVSGDDFSSSYRQAHLIIGGKDSNGQPLSDAWEFDYINQFWSQVIISAGGPLPRWSASGGRDYRILADTTSTNTTFYMSGGTDGQTMFPLNEVWEFEITGTLSSNLATNHTFGSWSSHTIGNIPGYSVNQASAVLGTSIVSVSGCNITADSNEACAEGNSYVVNAGPSSSETLVPPCPAPRYGGTLAFNPSAASSTFGSQVFLLLGTFNSSYWDDQGGLQNGEVAVLDIGTGAWSRVLPAGDPGTTGVPAYPSAREGAVAYSFNQALVGQNRSIASDTIVFGGQDELGNYLNEVWILRAYNGAITSSNSAWGGPAGQLQTGVDATGAGVTIQYLTQCATQLGSLPTTTSTAGGPTGTSTSNESSFEAYDVSLVHKLVAPLSIALLLPVILLTRLALPSGKDTHPTNRNIGLVYLSSLIAVTAYGLGLVGLITSFTSISTTMVVVKRATTKLMLQTGHGVAGLALFVGFYAIVPFLYLVSMCLATRRPQKEVVDHSEVAASRANSVDTAEKLASYTAAHQTQYPPSPPTSPRARLHSWGGSSFWLGRRSREGRVSSDSESMHSAGPQRAFEVVNRPARTRRASTNGLAYPNIEIYQRVPVAPRSLRDVDWLDRRRSLNAVNELDYAVHHGTRAQGLQNSSTPNTADMLSTRALMPTRTFSRTAYELPPPFELSLRIFFHMLVLGLCILSLIALWYRAPMSLFAVFLLWVVIFYISLFALAWNGRPTKSLLTTLIARLRGQPPQPVASPGTPTSRPLSITGTEQYPFPSDNRGPYLHQPPYRATGHDDVSTSQSPRSVETEEDDDDIDEDTRQRRIEEEMGRREVSIVTVPKRRLWITNPS